MRGDFADGDRYGIKQEKLSIEVTTRCNSACAYCFARSGNAGPSDLPVDLVRKMVAEGYAVGYRRIHITGGEPLLWKGLFEVLEEAFAMGYTAAFLNTNGTLLSETVCRAFAGHVRLVISVSLDGPEALHDRLRGEGSFRRAFRGVETALSAGIRLFVFTVASKGLIEELPRFAEEMCGMFPDLQSLTLIPLVEVKNGSRDMRKEFLEPEDFLKLVRTAALLNLMGLKIDFLNEPLVNVVSKRLNMPWLPMTYPLYREDSLMIMANLDIRLCHSDSRSLAKYDSGMIARVLGSEAYRKAVGPDERTCPRCTYNKLCRANGMFRPSAPFSIARSAVPFCRQVLDGIAA